LTYLDELELLHEGLPQFVHEVIDPVPHEHDVLLVKLKVPLKLPVYKNNK
jgi:hypothetical protein